MKVFLDFDDVLFDTRAFLGKLQAIFQEFGIPEELFKATYQAVKAQHPGKDFCYSFLAHIEKAKQHAAFDDAALCERLDAFLSDTKDFVFPDVYDFIQTLKSGQYAVHILSFGESGYQSRKIVGTGVDGLVAKVIVTQENKQQALAKEGLDPDEETWFFDDRVHFLEGVKGSFPFIRTVLVRRAEGRFTEEASELCDYIVTNFKEAEKLFA